MTTYNGEKYLIEQLNSILDQTFSDFELIICDDCSTDNTIQIIKDYIIKDSRIKLFQNIKNIGFKKNFEQAVKLCTCELIALCDQDDIWEKNHLEVLLSNIGNNYVIAGNNQFYDSNMNSLNKDFFSSHLFSSAKYPFNLDILKKVLLSGNCFQGASILFKKEILDLYLPLPEDVPYHDSWLVAIACSLEKFTCLDTIITKYRQHNRQVTHKNNNNKKDFFNKRILFCEKLINRTIISNQLIKQFLEQSKQYFINMSTLKGRIKNINFWSQEYKYIYPDNNTAKYYFRFIKFLLLNK